MAIKYCKRIVFTKTPLKGFFRHRDNFQIYPINLANAPTHSGTHHFPAIVEFSYDDEQNPKVTVFDDPNLNDLMSGSNHQVRKLTQITNLLSAITNYRFFFYNSSETLWTVPVPEEVTDDNSDQINNTPSVLSFPWYYYPELGKDTATINGFTDIEFDLVKASKHKIYYFYDPIENRKKEITVPVTIIPIIDSYYSLNEIELNVVDAAIFQLCNSLDLFSRMKSLSFFSAVSSIESLVNYEFRHEVLKYDCEQCKSLKTSSRSCHKCGEPIWGITAKFRDFLLKYVSHTSEAKKLYNAIYGIRSKIVHTEYLIHGDNYLAYDLTDETSKIFTKHLETIQLARRSIVNWLLKKY